MMIRAHAGEAGQKIPEDVRREEQRECPWLPHQDAAAELYEPIRW